MNCQVNPSKIPPIRFGIKNTVLARLAPLILLVTNTASPKPTALMQITEQSANTKVNRNEFQNLLSLNSFP